MSRIYYYGWSGTPSLMFNGQDEIVGAASDEDANAEAYMNIVRDHYFDPAPLSLKISSFDTASGHVGVSIKMYSETASIENATILFILLEDDVARENTRISRQILTEAFSLSGAGNTLDFEKDFDIDPSWIRENLHVVSFIQLQDRRIIQTGTDYELPEYNIRAVAPSARVLFGASDTANAFEPISLFNMGAAENFTIQAVIDGNAPEGWEIRIREADGTVHDDSYSFFLDEDADTPVTVIVNPASKGSLAFHLEITSPNLERPLEIPMSYVTDDIDVLLIDDDGGHDYEKYFEAALTAAGRSYGIWDRSSAPLPEAALALRLLVWNVGLGYPSLDPDDRAFLMQYLDGGGNLFLSGQDIGWDLNSTRSSNRDVSFYHEYLHAVFQADDVNNMNIDGIPGDPVSDSIMLHIAGGDGADNQETPSRIGPYDADAVPIFTYHGASETAGLRSEDAESGARIVYLAFGFEGIDTEADRADLMRAAIHWLQPFLPIGDLDGTRMDAHFNIEDM